MTHTETPRNLAESTQQRNFDHIFTSIPVFDGTMKEDFSEMFERLEVTCLQSRWDIIDEALGMGGGDIRMCLMGLPVTLLWMFLKFSASSLCSH